MKTAVKIKRVSAQAELVQALAIRIRVFVREQRVPAEIELDADDRQAVHFLALKSGKAVGAARIVLKRGKAKIGRMAVLKSHRGKGVGKALLKHTVDMSRRLKAQQVYLNAQVAVIGFYQKLGFRAVGPVFSEAGIPHRKMIWSG
jgi:ElaA protein